MFLSSVSVTNQDLTQRCSETALIGIAQNATFAYSTIQDQELPVKFEGIQDGVNEPLPVKFEGVEESPGDETSTLIEKADPLDEKDLENTTPHDVKANHRSLSRLVATIAAALVIIIVALWITVVTGAIMYVRNNFSYRSLCLDAKYSCPNIGHIKNNLRRDVRVKVNYPDADILKPIHDYITRVQDHVDRNHLAGKEPKFSAVYNLFTIPISSKPQHLEYAVSSFKTEIKRIRGYDEDATAKALRLASKAYTHSRNMATSEGNELHCLHISPENRSRDEPRRWVIHFNGISGNMFHANREHQYLKWVQEGYDVLTFRPSFWDAGIDRKTYCEPDTLTMKVDVLTFIDAIMRSHIKEGEEINVYGHSYGGHFSLFASVYLHDHHRSPSAVGFEAGFTDVLDVADVHPHGALLTKVTFGMCKKVIKDHSLVSNHDLMKEVMSRGIPLGIFACKNDDWVGKSCQTLYNNLKTLGHAPYYTELDCDHSYQVEHDEYYGKRLQETKTHSVSGGRTASESSTSASD